MMKGSVQRESEAAFLIVGTEINHCSFKMLILQKRISDQKMVCSRKIHDLKVSRFEKIPKTDFGETVKKAPDGTSKHGKCL
jgi:hypothetical protein